MLPLGIGWSLWIHLFVQYPKSALAAVLMIAVLAVPLDRFGFEHGGDSAGRRIVCGLGEGAGLSLCGQRPPEEETRRPPE